MRITLRQRREARGLTQIAAARLCGIPQSTLSHYETASIVRPGWAIVCRMAKVYGCEPVTIMRGIDAQRRLNALDQREKVA
jgi:transcriptional regulator with XRE-family HTH domain